MGRPAADQEKLQNTLTTDHCVNYERMQATHPANDRFQQLCSGLRKQIRANAALDFLTEAITAEPELVVACITNAKSEVSLSFPSYFFFDGPGVTRRLKPVIDNFSDEERAAVTDALVAHPDAHKMWRSACAHLDQRTFLASLTLLSSEDFIPEIKRFASQPDAALAVIRGMHPPYAVKDVRRVALAFEKPFLADPQRLSEALRTGGETWPDVLFHLAGEEEPLHDLPSNVTTVRQLEPLQQRLVKRPADAVALVQEGLFSHPLNLYPTVTDMLTEAAASAPDTRSAMIDAVCARTRLPEGDRAVAALSTALDDQRVDRHLWPSVTTMRSGETLIAYLQALGRTPDLLAHASEINCMFGFGSDRTGHGAVSLDIARELIRAFAPTIDRVGYRSHLLSHLQVADGWPAEPEQRLFLEGLAVTPAERAAATIASGASSLNPVYNNRHLVGLLQDPELENAVVSHLGLRVMLNGAVAASAWISAISDARHRGESDV